jgi:membrane fusion protein, protease secretion system
VNHLKPDSVTPPPLDTDVDRSTRLGLRLLVIGFGGFLLWAALVPLGEGVTGTGSVVVTGGNKTVQSLVSGQVTELFVTEGMPVKAGQMLVRLNTIQSQSQLDTVLGQWINSRSNEARLIAERSGQSGITWPDDLDSRASDPRVTAAKAAYTNLFQTRQRELASRRSLLKSESVSLAFQVKGLEEVRRHQTNRMNAQERTLASHQELVKQGFVSPNRINELDSSLGEYGAELATTHANLDRTRQSEREVQLKLLQLDEGFRSEVESQLASVSAEVSMLSERLRALEFEVTSATIRAPTSGQVLDLAIHTVGGVIQAGQRLMDIVPIDAPWQIRAKFPLTVADSLKPGQPITLRFSSLQRVETPVLTGKIATVSADSVIDSQTRTSYYLATITPDTDLLNTLSKARLIVKPGMEVQVMASTGERTLLNYLLKPIGDRLASSLTEK